MIQSFISIISGIWNSGGEKELTGAEAVVTDYHERLQMVEDGHYAEGVLVGVDRLVDEGIFQDNAVAQLWFDLGKYGQYPVTLSLPDGPDETSELERFVERLNMSVPDLVEASENEMAVPFIRCNGEWQFDWDSIEASGE